MTHQETLHHDHDGISEDREQRPPVYFTVLFYGLIIWGVAFCAFYLLSGWSSEAEFQEKMTRHEQTYQKSPPPPEPAKPAAAAVPAVAAVEEKIDAAAIYAQRCAMCHGQDAKGGIGPDLTAAAYNYGKTREAVTESISQGRPKGMPGFASQMSGAQIDAVVDYLLAL
ncbi:MAG: c-type cytochrome [Desulfuromonadales bacterium]|nr:c-type cytochrome [Desulfuromonadales bacterium]